MARNCTEPEIIYELLLKHYQDPQWWPAETPYEVIVGAVLTQNTAWNNVELALANFGTELSPERILSLNPEELRRLIRPAGFFNQKAEYLKAITRWYAQYDFKPEAVRKQDMGVLRPELLAIKGIGPETADSILLYAFDLPSFVVDSYTKRLCNRFPLDAGSKYTAVQNYFVSALPESSKVYQNMHALLVLNAKAHCRKKADCTNCPLGLLCQRCGL